MANNVHQTDVFKWAQPQPRPCRLTGLPIELLFCIIGCSIAVGRERDVSALARTSKYMRNIINPELYRLVIKHRTFYVVHWAAQRNRVGTLEIAFANGADPNQMRTSETRNHPDLSGFRPNGWGLDTVRKLDWAVSARSLYVGIPNDDYPTAARWHEVWFSSTRLSKARIDHLRSLSVHYILPRDLLCGTHFDRSGTRLSQLSTPLDDNFTFPPTLSPADMDDWDVKLAFVQLFQYWHSPLHCAARFNRVEVTEALIANGADLDATSVGVCRCARQDMPTSVARSASGNHVISYTALHVAICFGGYKAARVLVSHGAHRMAKVFSGFDDRNWIAENPLHRALSIRSGRGFSYEFIKFLLDHGYAARIEERSHEGLTPLLIACHAIGDPAQDSVVKLLLQYGADPDNPGPDYPGSPFSQIAPVHGVEWCTAVLWAARDGDFRLARLLLDHGANANAKSSAMRVTMLHAVCSLGRFKAVTQDRIELLDSLLATSTEKDVNTFDVRERTPLTMLINWALLWTDAFDTDTSEMESRLFGKGADIMAGVEMGKVTPFEYMVWKAVGTYHDTPGKRAHVGDKVLALLRGSRINEHPHRPTAMLNQFLGYLDRQLHATGRVLLDMIPFVLHALIKAGFGPAEVDRHGDTAMNSLLQLLLACPYWAVPPNRSLLVSIMALLQEHGAALHQRNNKGYMAFDYLQQIMEYDGESTEHATLARVMSCIVQPGQDEHGNMCLKFHPTKHLFGSLSGDSTLMMIQRNPSRWLVCEHWCRYYCGSSRASDGQCGCARTPFQTLAKCDGDCCRQEGDHWIEN